MVLEAIMLCIDNSEWARNGDYAPSRFDAQRETLNFLAAAKIQSNPETTVGLLSLAGDRVEVHISPTRSPGSIMTALAKDVRISGESANFLSGLKTASLALKNRQNKTQRQRIILLAGSPVRDDVRELIRLAKGFKKNSVAVDVINFGAENAANENAEKWEQFIEAVNAGDNSHLVNIPPGPHILSDMVLSSAIMQEEGRGGAGGVGGASGSGGGGGGFDIDPNQDPEMAMAIRMSMEEERARQQRMTGETAGAAAPAATAAAGDSATAAVAADAAGGDSGAPMEDDEEALLQQAIAMSMQQSQPDDVPAAAAEATPSIDASAAASASASAAAANPADIGAAMADPDFISSLLASVTGTATMDTDVSAHQPHSAAMSSTTPTSPVLSSTAFPLRGRVLVCQNMLDQLTGESSEQKEEKKDDESKEDKR